MIRTVLASLVALTFVFLLGTPLLIYAVLITFMAVLAIIFLGRLATRMGAEPMSRLCWRIRTGLGAACSSRRM